MERKKLINCCTFQRFRNNWNKKTIDNFTRSNFTPHLGLLRINSRNSCLSGILILCTFFEGTKGICFWFMTSSLVENVILAFFRDSSKNLASQNDGYFDSCCMIPKQIDDTPHIATTFIATQIHNWWFCNNFAKKVKHFWTA